MDYGQSSLDSIIMNKDVPVDVWFPCNFDHNGECLVCDCWPDACAYVRYLNKDYKYETKEELEAMFGEKNG